MIQNEDQMRIREYMEEHLIQGSEAWKEFRKTKISGTDAAVVMQLSPWESPYSLWRKKMDLDPPQVQTAMMARGNELEPIARNWLKREKKIECSPTVITKDFMMASLDGLSQCETFIVEIKCGQKSYKEAEDGRIADYYRCQMFHQMHCVNVTYSLYVAVNGQDGIVIKVERDQNF